MTTPVIKIGTTYAGLALFTAYSIRAPIANPITPGAEYVQMSSGNTVARGYKQAQLWWPALNAAERTALRALIPGASAALYFQLPNELYVDTTYTGIAIWPPLTPDTSRAYKFSIMITKLVVYP